MTRRELTTWSLALALVCTALPGACGLGLRSRFEKALYRGSMSEWKGLALTPKLVRFACEQTGEPDPKWVLKNVRKFNSKAKAYWPRPIGISRHDRDGRYGVFEAADVEHQVWFRLEKPMTEGETRVFTLPDDRTASFTYSERVPSPIIKFNQLGYVPSAEEKYAYVGEWAGTGGPVELLVGKFSLIDEKSGKAVCTGQAKRRPADQMTEDGVTPWTGETPWELDFSEVTTPGRYHLEVDGVGRSDSFSIGNETIEKAFEIHMAGMRRQRCGETCHQYAYRGNFPADDHYGSLGAGTRFGFFNSAGRHERDVTSFAVIALNVDRCKHNEKVRVEGGWHDAADYDRRPYHLQAVCDFAAVALLRPSCTNALEEAYWGLKHLLAAQEENGGVGTWIETIGHPGPGEGPDCERRDHRYFIARPTRNSTLAFAAHAAMTALAAREQILRDESGKEAWSARFAQLTNAAVRAWNFAMDEKNGESWMVDYGKEKLVYRQDNELNPDMLVKAGFDLSLLTGDDDYLDPVRDAKDQVAHSFRCGGNWKASPLLFIELDHFERQLESGLRIHFKGYVRKVTQEADEIINQLESAWPYRMPWHSTASGHVTKMGWGVGLPLTRARVLIAAHAMTWQEKYINAAYLANDCHNGANPEGETYTSGLGIRPTGRYLDLEGRYPVGVTPFRFCYFVEPKCDAWVFPDGMSEKWPIWRRYANVEIGAIRNAEFSVWETIAPAAAVTGYLTAYAKEGRGEP